MREIGWYSYSVIITGVSSGDKFTKKKLGKAQNQKNR